MTTAFLATVWIHSAAKLKVACVGDSITFGYTLNENTRSSQSYPGQLQMHLGSKIEVRQFAKPGCTLMKLGWLPPFMSTPEYQQSINYKADWVLIMLGTNDSHPRNWQHAKQFESDYRELVNSYRAGGRNPRIVILVPPKLGGVAEADQVSNFDKFTVPAIRKAAKNLKVGVVDAYSLLQDKKFFVEDGIHLNPAGCKRLADRVSAELKTKILASLFKAS
jgi:sialate O-acetylesterase